MEIRSKLNGRIVLIRGNHDRINKASESEVHDYLEIKDSGQLVVMSHYPLMVWNHQYNGAVHLFGHVHNSRDNQLIDEWKSKLIANGIPCRMWNVGAMFLGYTPRTLREIIND